MLLGSLSDGLFPVGETYKDLSVLKVSDRWEDAAPGMLYAAIRGRRFDGHRMLRRVWEQGAVCAVVQTPDPAVPLPQFAVADPREVYARLCARLEGDPADKLHLIGITGTNGKTTTACLLRHLLTACGLRCGLIGTVEVNDGKAILPSPATTPQPPFLHCTLRAMAENGCTHGVLEVSSQSLDQSRTAGITFDVGCFTNLSVDHLDYHGTMDAYRRAKLRLFDQCRLRLVNGDSDYAAPFLAYPDSNTFSLTRKADFTANDVVLGREGATFRYRSPSGEWDAFLPLWGRYNVYNALAALACAELSGADPRKCVAALRTFPGVRGRMERVFPRLPFRLIIDYAHTPDGLESALRALRSVTAGRLIVVFGCGGERDQSKRGPMGCIASRFADLAVITSDNPRGEDPEAILAAVASGADPEKSRVIPDRTEAIAYALHTAQPGDCVLLAGKGHETYQILADRTVRYDEREIARDFLKKEGYEI